jgi:hypothetical protein
MMTGLQITSKALAGLSVVTGMYGTYLMYKYSVTGIQSGPGYLSPGPEYVEKVMNAPNDKLLKRQRIGFYFLQASVLLVGFSALIG